MPELAAWSIFLAPLLSFVLIAVLRPVLGPEHRLNGRITVAALLAAFALSLYALAAVMGNDGRSLEYPAHEWLTVPDKLTINIGIVMDSLTAVMVVVVTGVSLLVQFYGQEYMKGDKSYARYYGAMSLFTASMLGLVMASNLILLYAFWELVGLCSYLLIGHYNDRPSANDAAKKAFIVTRLGDLGLLAAIVWAYVATGTFEISELHGMAIAGTLGGVALTWLCLGIFAGAVGKSGQFPLHVWLPDAMEGPTPVSALIHAATMVAAGVFLVARMFPLFEHSEGALTTVAWIGGGTAVFAATMALVSTDIKRVMAYSTVSQLGYMMLALGMGALGPAIFHLFNHAFFKALLFLGAGSIHHAVGTYDMRYMGGLRKVMPWTFVSLVVAGLSLSGIFPLSGFWSKDAILHSASANGIVAGAEGLYWLGVLAAALTGFYVFRMIFMTFTGQYRGGAEAERAAAGNGEGHEATAGTGHGHHLRESPWMIVVPLAVLAVPSVLSGLANLPWNFIGIPAESMTEFLGGHAEAFSISVAAISSAVAAAGIAFAYLVYVNKAIAAEALGRTFRPAYVLLSRKYYMDDLYEDLFTSRFLYGGVARTADWLDANVVDRGVNATGWVGRNVGRVPSMLQTGQVQVYGAVISLGLVVIVAAFWIWG